MEAHPSPTKAYVEAETGDWISSIGPSSSRASASAEAPRQLPFQPRPADGEPQNMPNWLGKNGQKAIHILQIVHDPMCQKCL